MNFSRFASGAVLTALLIPQLSLAATLTPQQALNQAVNAAFQHSQSQAVSLDVNVEGSFKPARLSAKNIQDSGARTKASSFKLQLVVRGEDYPCTGAAQQDGQGSIRIAKLTSAGEIPLSLSDVATFEWKMISGVTYIRIAGVSPELLAMLQSQGMEMSMLQSVIGTWLKIDPETLRSSLQQLLPADAGALTVSESSSSDVQALLRMAPFLQVLRVNKKVTVGSQVYSRLNVRIHPNVWTQLDKELVKDIERQLVEVKKTSPKLYATQRSQKIVEQRKAMQEFRTMLAKLQMVVMINDKTGMIERVEGAFQNTMPAYTYVYRGTKSVKIVEGYDTVKANFVMGMKAVTNQVLVEPTPFVTLEALMQSLLGGLLGTSASSGVGGSSYESMTMTP